MTERCVLKITFAVLAAALASTASAGWRDLRIDASSEASFETSVAAFKEELSAPRRHAFERALQDIWTMGATKATSEGRAYTRADYLAQLNGLGYEEVVLLPDPTGEKTQAYRAEYYRAREPGAGPPDAEPVFQTVRVLNAHDYERVLAGFSVGGAPAVSSTELTSSVTVYLDGVQITGEWAPKSRISATSQDFPSGSDVEAAAVPGQLLLKHPDGSIVTARIVRRVKSAEREDEIRR